MEQLSESLGVGFYRVGRITIPVRMASHATDRLEQRFPGVEISQVKEILNKGVQQIAQPSGHVELGQYLIIDQNDGVMLPIKIQKNDRPGYERQTMGFIPTVMDWKLQSDSDYPEDLLDKYHFLKKIYVESASRWEVPNLSKTGTFNGEPCTIIYV